MPKIILTRGLPASGKSTWARELVRSELGRWKRINKDDMRLMLDEGKWSKKNEQFILLMRDTMALSALEHGFNVIIDDTNLHEKHLLRMKELAKEVKKLWNKDVEVEVKDFTNVSLETCIERDLKRPNSVGEKVIKQMYQQFLAKTEEYNSDDNLPSAIICDLDGTLALFGDANPYDRDFTKDLVNEKVLKVLESITHGTELRIILVSGRKDTAKEQTENWLKQNSIKYDHIFMRKGEDVRKDTVVKREIFENEIRKKFNVYLVLDDRNQVVDMWRSLGITCFQVAAGDF